MLGTTYQGNLSLSFILQGRLSLGVDLSGAIDSRDINELMEMLKGRRVKISIEELP